MKIWLNFEKAICRVASQLFASFLFARICVICGKKPKNPFGIVSFTNPTAFLIKSLILVVLGATSRREQLFANPFRLGFAGKFYCALDLGIFFGRKARGNESAALFFMRQGWPADFWRIAHLIFFFASGGKGVWSNARTASSNLTPLKLGSIFSGGRLMCFSRFDFPTISLSAPRNVRSFLFYKAILQAAKPVPSNRFTIG
jgi:hypothetical protein